MKMPAPPYRKIGSIWLPGGGEFEVWSNYAIVVPLLTLTDPICPVARPRFPDAYWLEIVEMFRGARLLGPEQFLHWVGRQTDIEHVCTCFGILEPGESEHGPR